MDAKMLVSIVVGISICLIPMACANSGSGIATSSVAGPSSLDLECPPYDVNDPYTARAGTDIWDGPKTCGQKYFILCTNSVDAAVPDPCTGEAVIVTIVDQCLATDSCGNFRLSPEAFSKISNVPSVPIAVNYNEVQY